MLQNNNEVTQKFSYTTFTSTQPFKKLFACKKSGATKIDVLLRSALTRLKVVVYVTVGENWLLSANYG